ncbi:hypothetical protein V6N11_020203 [Hibiscus sabdariffa]|uniref:CCHC-type domain-containing protein n=1 Tax=Hibiscus sabdariffa TaxID=183260 RepID=A0ABR2Q7Q7_9ROSI
MPADIQENVEARRKWKIKCRKALFALRTFISKEFIDHMAKSLDPEAVLFSKGKHYKKYTYRKSNKEKTDKGKANVSYSARNQNVFNCNRCGKPGHIKKYCRMKLSKVNVASDKDDDE